MAKTREDVLKHIAEFIATQDALDEEEVPQGTFDLDIDDNLNKLLKRIDVTQECSIDTETNGFDWALGKAAFMSQFSPDEKSSYYTFSPATTLAVLEFMEEKKHLFIMHNAAFDFPMIRNFCNWAPSLGYSSIKLFDTMLGFRIRYPSADTWAKVAELKTASKRYCADMDVTGPEAAVDKWRKDKKNYVKTYVGDHELLEEPTYDLVPKEIMIPYACQDTILTIKSAHGLKADLESWVQADRHVKAGLPHLRDVASAEMRTSLTVIEIERFGIKVNINTLNAMLEMANGEVQNYIRIWKTNDLWKDVLFSSHTQMRKLLYETLKEPIKHLTENGVGSTGEIALADLETELGKQAAAVYIPLTNWRLCLSRLEEIEKFITTDGRVRTNLKPDKARTGRFSSSKPALQNLPTPNPLEPWTMVKSVVEPDLGCEFLFADFSQVELRLAAYYSGNKPMIDALNNGEDFHALTAAYIFKIPKELVTPKQRKMAKTMNFTMLYGGGIPVISEKLQFTDCKLTESEATESFNALGGIYGDEDGTIWDMLAALLLKRYKIANADTFKFIDKAKLKAKQYKCVYTKFGLLLPLNLKFWNKKLGKISDQFYKAPNSIIQGGAAGMLREALKRSEALLELYCLENDLKIWKDCAIILTVHDELIFSLPSGHAKPFAQMIDPHMKIWDMFPGVNFTMDYSLCEAGSNWAQKKELKLC